MRAEGTPSPESSFLRALMSDAPVEKTAVDLEPETADILGTATVTPQDLNQLEASAASAAEAPGEPEEVPAEEQAVDEEVQEEPVRGTHGALFTDRRAHPLTLLEVLTAKYQTEWASWEPETLWWAIRKDFGPLGDIARNKIMALKVAVQTDTTWQDWDTFEDSGLAWNDIIPVFGSIQLLSPAQAAFAVRVLRGIRPDEPFAHEVSAYLAAILDDHGFIYAPEEWFPGAQAILDRREHTAEFRVEVEDAWSKVRGVDPRSVKWDETNPLDIHMLKLIVVDHYIEARDELTAQSAGSAPVANPAPPVP